MALHAPDKKFLLLLQANMTIKCKRVITQQLSSCGALMLSHRKNPELKVP